MYSAKCFLEVNNGSSGNNRIRQGVPVAYYSIAELIICNVKFKLRGLKFKTVTSGGNSRDDGRGSNQAILPCKLPLVINPSKSRFARFSRRESLLKAIIFLKVVARSVSKSDINQKNDLANTLQQDSTHFLLKNAQRESYPEEIQSLQNQIPLSKSTYIRVLRPLLDYNGLIMVGGRLERAQVLLKRSTRLFYPDVIILPCF